MATAEMMSVKERRDASADLQRLQKQRTWYLKSRNMVMNRLKATVAGDPIVGYHNGMSEAERKKCFAEAGKLLRPIAEEEIDCPNLNILVRTTLLAIDGFDEQKKSQEKLMLAIVKHLPVFDWVEHADQRGFGPLFLGIVIGETGDLANYANPAKVWRRLGCAPFTSDGKTLMGATWKSGREGKLHASEWEEFGYSPRRRSISFLIGEGIVKLNQEGPYKTRYLEAKEKAIESHPEWIVCSKCKGSGKTGKGASCANCRGTGTVMMRCHRHGMLLATKLLLKNLWIEWNQ